MRAVPPRAVAAALLPAAVVVVLFFFDHGISALMARDVLRDRSVGGGEGDDTVTAEAGAAAAEKKEEEGAALEAGGGRRAPASKDAAAAAAVKAPAKTKLKPSAYAYDLFLCGLSMVAAGVLGLPPTNGVLPQAPMHTHALSVAAGERARRIAAAAEVEEHQAEAEAEAAVAGGSGSSLRRRPAASKKEAPTAASSALPPSHHHHHHLLEPLETRVASLLQYLAILACAFAGPLLRLIPRGAIAGYFAFMALEWVGDSEMVDRLRWLLSDAAGRASVRRPAAAFADVPAVSKAASEGALSSYSSAAAAPPPPPPPPPARWTRAPTKSIAAFTAFQLACVALVYALTWVPVAGILFPVPIMLFVPLRTFLLPRAFGRAQIELLDGP